MKSLIFVICLMAVAVLPQTAFAGHHHEEDDDYEFAEYHETREAHRRDNTIIIVVKPRAHRKHQNTYIRECWTEETRYPRHSNHRDAAGRMITGGIVGGVIGHQFGRGHGRDAFALLGTLIGASLGHDMAYQHDRGERHRVYKKRCRLSQRSHRY